MSNTLYPIQNDTKNKLWCGPAALALISGHPISSVDAAIRASSGRDRVMAVYPTELIRAARRLGWSLRSIYKSHRRARVSLDRWRKCFITPEDSRKFLVLVTNHYVCVSGEWVADNQSLAPQKNSLYGSSRVVEVWEALKR